MRRRASTWLALLCILGLFAAACGSDDDDDEGTGQDTDTTETTEAAAEKGGTLVIGAEQEPACADWIGSCAGASWGYWVMGIHTMPRPLSYNWDKAEYEPTPLLAGEPELDEGPPMTVTYKINPKAVWSDGTPITSSDFKYTWDQIANGTAIYDKTGYDKIQGVDDSKKDTAVVTYKEPYSAWRDIFAGFYGIFPKHLLEGKDRNAEMKDSYRWSGGPWLIESWTKGQEVKLVPNDKYWDKKPNLDAVVFKFITDTAAEAQAFKTGQVSMIYPQAQLELTELKGLPDTKFDVVTGMNYEALWMNVTKPPLDSKAVREALAYATDRNAIVQQLFGPVQPDIKPIDALMTPANKKWYPETKSPFAKYKVDLAKVDSLMKGDGWTKGADGIWAKGGQRAVIENSTTAGNKRRELTQQILQSQWKEAGFELKANNTRSATLFGEWGPKGIYVSAIYAQVPSSPDPNICSTFCSRSIPSEANGGTGSNWTRLSDSAIDKAFEGDEKELDEDKRADLIGQGHAALSAGLPALPIDPFPDIIIYNSAKVKGPVVHNFGYSPFARMNEWSCTGGQC